MDRKAFAKTTAIVLFLLVFAVSIVFITSEKSVSASGENWWNTTWQTRVQLDINVSNLGANETDFPILVLLNSTKIDYSVVDADSIRFVNWDNTTQLSHECPDVEWNESGDSPCWVKVNTTDTYFWAYYNNTSSVANGENIVDTWSDNYLGVWHLAETNPDDSLGSYDCTDTGTVNLVNGNVGKGLDYSASAESASWCGDVDTGATFYVSAWLNEDTLEQSPWISKKNTYRLDLCLWVRTPV